MRFTITSSGDGQIDIRIKINEKSQMNIGPLIVTDEGLINYEQVNYTRKEVLQVIRREIARMFGEGIAEGFSPGFVRSILQQQSFSSFRATSLNFSL